MSSAPTSPRRTRKDNRLPTHALEPLLDDIKAVAFDPPDLLINAVNGRVVFCTLKDFWILLNGKYLFPAARSRKCDSVSASARERVYEYRLGRWRCLCHMLCYLAKCGEQIVNKYRTCLDGGRTWLQVRA